MPMRSSIALVGRGDGATPSSALARRQRRGSRASAPNRSIRRGNARLQSCTCDQLRRRGSFLDDRVACLRIRASVCFALGHRGAARRGAGATARGSRPSRPAVVRRQAAAARHHVRRIARASRHSFSLPEIMGGGAALFDMDGDGDLDALSRAERRPRRPADKGAGNRLYRNRRHRPFEDVTAGSGADVARLRHGRRRRRLRQRRRPRPLS